MLQEDLLKDMEGALNATYESERGRSDTLDSVDHPILEPTAPQRSKSPATRTRNSKALGANAQPTEKLSPRTTRMSRQERIKQERQLAEERAQKIETQNGINSHNSP